jgi:diadenosine tetraphosphatase ApaH/serine/threonine PP2A family protein phosphatase
MTRLAVLSDVHGNLLALEAVLADVQTQGAPDGYWVLGDLAAFCPWPVETLARLRALPNVAFLQGNTDRYVVTGRRPVLLVRSPEDWAGAPIQLAERDANFRWTVERLSWADCEFLRDLPTRLEMDVGAGSPRPYGRVVAFHANPTDDEVNLLPNTPDGQVRPHLAGVNARLVLCGHTHRPMDRTVDGVRLVNDGSVGFSLDGDPRPAYALLDFAGGECTVALRRVEYDREAVLAELERVQHPGRAFVGRMIREARP